MMMQWGEQPCHPWHLFLPHAACYVCLRKIFRYRFSLYPRCAHCSSHYPALLKVSFCQSPVISHKSYCNYINPVFLCTSDRSYLQNPPATMVQSLRTRVDISVLQHQLASAASDPGRPIFSTPPRIPGIVATEFGHCQHLDQFLGLGLIPKCVDMFGNG